MLRQEQVLTKNVEYLGCSTGLEKDHLVNCQLKFTPPVMWNYESLDCINKPKVNLA